MLLLEIILMVHKNIPGCTHACTYACMCSQVIIPHGAQEYTRVHQRIDQFWQVTACVTLLNVGGKGHSWHR